MFKSLLFLLLTSIYTIAAVKSFTTTVEENGSLIYPQKSIFYEKNIKVFQQDFKLYIDTTPSLVSQDLILSLTSNTNPFYYKNSSNEVVRTVDAAGKTISSYTVKDRTHHFAYWTDCEIKAIDKYGNIVYFTSTIRLQYQEVANLHPTITDKTPKVYYWVSGDNAASGCYGARRELTDLNSSIGANLQSYNSCTGIWIFPNLKSTEGRAVPVYIGFNVLDTQNYPKKGSGNNSNAANTAAGYKWIIWGNYIRETLTDPDTTILCWRQTTDTGEVYSSNKLWRPVRVEYYGDFKEIK